MEMDIIFSYSSDELYQALEKNNKTIYFTYNNETIEFEHDDIGINSVLRNYLGDTILGVHKETANDLKEAVSKVENNILMLEASSASLSTELENLQNTNDWPAKLVVYATQENTSLKLNDTIDILASARNPIIDSWETIHNIVARNEAKKFFSLGDQFITYKNDRPVVITEGSVAPIVEFNYDIWFKNCENGLKLENLWSNASASLSYYNDSRKSTYDLINHQYTLRDQYVGVGNIINLTQGRTYFIYFEKSTSENDVYLIINGSDTLATQISTESPNINLWKFEAPINGDTSVSIMSNWRLVSKLTKISKIMIIEGEGYLDSPYMLSLRLNNLGVWEVDDSKINNIPTYMPFIPDNAGLTITGGAPGSIINIIQTGHNLIWDLVNFDYFYYNNQTELEDNPNGHHIVLQLKDTIELYPPSSSQDIYEMLNMEDYLGYDGFLFGLDEDFKEVITKTTFGPIYDLENNEIYSYVTAPTIRAVDYGEQEAYSYYANFDSESIMTARKKENIKNGIPSSYVLFSKESGAGAGQINIINRLGEYIYNQDINTINTYAPICCIY